MTTPRPLLLLLVPFVLLAVSCTSYEPPKNEAVSFQRETGLRQDCNTILGTAFHSTEERQWFEQNCSRWPAVPAVVVAPAAPQGQQPGQPQVVSNDTPQCAAMRGRPYGSENERTWFLANCLRADPPPPAQQQTQQQAVVQGARPGAAPSAPAPTTNSAICEALRRSPNPSDAERRWYFTYCDNR